MKARIIDPSDEWPDRIGEVCPMFDHPGICPDAVWMQFDDGEGGEYVPDQIEIC